MGCLSDDTAMYGIGEPGQHMVTVYWRFGEKFSGALLYYIAGGGNAAFIESTFLNTVRSFRPLEKPAR